MSNSVRVSLSRMNLFVRLVVMNESIRSIFVTFSRMFHFVCNGCFCSRFVSIRSSFVRVSHHEINRFVLLLHHEMNLFIRSALRHHG